MAVAGIEWTGGKRWTIVDLGSSNGTDVNGTELEANGEPHTLKNGDIIRLGTDSVIKVTLTKPTAPTIAAPVVTEVLVPETVPPPPPPPVVVLIAPVVEQLPPQPVEVTETKNVEVEGYLSARVDVCIGVVRAAAEDEIVKLKKALVVVKDELRAELLHR